MDTTVRATCPGCGTVLRIPAQWVGQAVKCKKCGSVVRCRPKGEAGNRTGGHAPLDPTIASTPKGAGDNAFDYNAPGAGDDFPLPEPLLPPDPEPELFGDAPAPQPQQPVPGLPPNYPYPLPPGYAPPGAYGYPYAPPPGYPYAPPPGYPYPLSPGYPPPGATATPTGYPYGVPPGYPYAPPPGYPYAMPPGGPQPADPNAPAAPGMPPGFPPAGHQPPAPNQVPPSTPTPAPRPLPVGPVKPVGQVPAPPRPAPDPVPPSNEFKTDPIAIDPGRRYRRAGNPATKWVWVGVCLALAGGLVFGAITIMKRMDTKATHDRVAGVTDPAKLVEFLGSTTPAEREAAAKALREMGARAESALKVGAKSENPEVAKRSQELLVMLAGSAAPPAAKAGPFPRRMLFVHISRYMYLNPLTAGGPGGSDRSKAFAQRLAFDWRVPTDKADSQLFLVSDTAPPPETVTPMKNVVMGAYEQFFATSRPQDRIVVYFGGHALEIDGKAYLAPIEGDPEDPANTLIPLDDFYAKVKACKATQKVVIWDVCRFNPERGKQRPGSDPMPEGLAKALANPPEGVEAVITCSPGENALEFFALRGDTNAPGARQPPTYSGSSFLEASKHVGEKARPAANAPTPNDPLPVAEWAAATTKRTAEMAALSGLGVKQTVQTAGKRPPALVDYNPDEPAAKRFDYPSPPKGVAPTEIASMVQEFVVPPIKGDVAETGLTELAFREEALKDYTADATADEILKDKARYPLRATVLDVVQTLKEVWVFGNTGGNKDALVVLEEVMAPITDAKKKEIAALLDNWAIGIAKLELLDSELDTLAPMLSGETKRWRANFEYVRAALKYRLAYMKEYSKLMGDIRTETLPALDPKLHDRYRLASSETMKNKKEAEKLMEAAQEGFAKVITEHKNTPWAIQAKQDKAFSLGLKWQPAGSGKPGD